MSEQLQLTNFYVTYIGEEDYIDYETFINSLESLSTMIKEINDVLSVEYHYKGTIKFGISRINKGSIDVLFLLKEFVIPLITYDNVKTALNILNILIEYLKLKKFLDGKQPKNKEIGAHETKVINIYGDTYNCQNSTFNFISNEKMDEATRRKFAALDEDNSIRAVKICDKDHKELFVAERKDFPIYRQPVEFVDEKIKREVKEAKLKVIRISFENRYKSNFVYDSKIIFADINDENFYKDRNMVKFGYNDILHVELEIIKEYDDKLKMYVDKNYIIRKIFKHTSQYNPEPSFL